jgi:beta-lactamase class A
MVRRDDRSRADRSGRESVAPVATRVARRRAKRRRRRRQIAGVTCVVGLIALAGGVLITRAAPPARRSAQSSGRRGTPATPTSSTVVAATQRVLPGIRDVFSAPPVASYLAGVPDDLTAAVYDAATGRLSVYHPGVAQDTASIMKVDILATLLAQSQSDGTALSPAVQGLSTAMIEQSDNNDAQALWNAEGGATAVSAFDATAGLSQTTPDAAGYWGLSTTTAADQVQLLRQIAYPSAVLTPTSRSYELGLMSNVESGQAWGISSGVAPGVAVALKDGWLPLDAGGWQVNSEGYVDGDGRDYIIAVLTDGNGTEADGIDTIEDLSALIWQELAPAASATAPS